MTSPEYHLQKLPTRIADMTEDELTELAYRLFDNFAKLAKSGNSGAEAALRGRGTPKSGRQPS